MGQKTRRTLWSSTWECWGASRFQGKFHFFDKSPPYLSPIKVPISIPAIQQLLSNTKPKLPIAPVQQQQTVHDKEHKEKRLSTRLRPDPAIGSPLTEWASPSRAPSPEDNTITEREKAQQESAQQQSCHSSHTTPAKGGR